MALPANCSEQELIRLLELFPIKSLREAWPNTKGTKDELSKEIAIQRDLEPIADFVDANFNLCKQHVYVLGTNTPKLPPGADVAVMVKKAAGAEPHALYVARVEYAVVLRNPFEEITLPFLWPFRVDLIGKHFLLRFVVLEKNLATYLNRPLVKADRSLDEENVLESFGANLALKAVDLNKGVKKLWAADFMDARRAQYKKPNSTATEAMDEARGIKKDNLDIYKLIVKVPLYETLFVIPATKEKKEVALWIDPTRGKIRFPRYAENMGDTDNVIRDILKKNS